MTRILLSSSAEHGSTVLDTIIPLLCFVFNAVWMVYFFKRFFCRIDALLCRSKYFSPKIIVPSITLLIAHTITPLFIASSSYYLSSLQDAKETQKSCMFC